MKKWKTAILLFDLVAGLLFLGLWEQRGNATYGEGAIAAFGQVKSDADREASTVDGTVGNQAEDVKKIALTFDDEVIIGLSQEISYIRSRFYDLVLF